ncbi:MAG TPA: hypothetical protein VD838_21255 [Anaeromyxobacteraceae bacterium]|nr:hypothetical protein [Anaeromyxobacteraceae bacterium]
MRAAFLLGFLARELLELATLGDDLALALVARMRRVQLAVDQVRADRVRSLAFPQLALRAGYAAVARVRLARPDLSLCLLLQRRRKVRQCRR